MFRHRAKYGKGGKQENQMERNEMKHVKCMTDTPTMRPCDPATLWPIDSPRRQLNMPTWLANVTSPQLGLVCFGLATCCSTLRTCQAFSLVYWHCLQPSPDACLRVCVFLCVCVWPYTCSCRTLTSRNSRKFNHAQLTRADRRLLQSLLTLSPSSCQGAAARARVGSDFFLLPSRLDNHVEYLALMSPHSTSISLLVWPDLAAVQYVLKNPSTKKRKAKVPPARPTLTRCSPAAIIVFAVLCGLPATGEENIHYCPNKAKGGACDWVGAEEVDGAVAGASKS